MTQAGVYKITLYENRNISINYTLFTISTDGETIELSDLPTLEIEPQDIIINYSIGAKIDDLTAQQVSIINNSIYGWIAKFEFLDDTTKIVERPFFNETTNQINSNQSHSRNINLISWNKQGLIAFN